MAFDVKQPDKVLIFDIRGTLAHFRKYYTNSSSLSYSFPPRTVVIGLIAGLLGYANERAKAGERIYYELFNTVNCKVAMSLLTRIKKVMQTVNYIKTKTDQASTYSFESLITGKRGAPTQIPLEILMSDEGIMQDIVYRVYFHHNDETRIYSNMKNRLENQRFVYPPYLGISEFIASINYVYEGKLEKNSNNTVEIKTICRLEDIEPDFKGNNLQYLIEKMPVDFLNDRTPLKPENYIFEMKNRYLKAKLKNNAASYSVCYKDMSSTITENIMFM